MDGTPPAPFVTRALVGTRVGSTMGGLGGRHYRGDRGAACASAAMNGYCDSQDGYGSNGRAYAASNAIDECTPVLVAIDFTSPHSVGTHRSRAPLPPSEARGGLPVPPRTPVRVGASQPVTLANEDLHVLRFTPKDGAAHHRGSGRDHQACEPQEEPAAKKEPHLYDLNLDVHETHTSSLGRPGQPQRRLYSHVTRSCSDALDRPTEGPVDTMEARRHRLTRFARYSVDGVTMSAAALLIKPPTWPLMLSATMMLKLLVWFAAWSTFQPRPD